MSLQETKMAAMKLAFFFFTLSAHLGAYHARPVHDSCIYQSFDRQPPAETAEVIQMVTGEEEPSQGNAVYGGDNVEGRRTPPRGPRPGGETIYGGEYYPRAPPLPPMAPSQGITVYGGGNLEGRPSPRKPVPGGETIYGRDNPKAPPPPKVAPSRGQTTYGRDNPISGGARVAKKRLADILALLLPLYDETVYGREYLNAQPSPQGPGSGGQSAPPSLNKPKTVPSLKPDSSMDGRDDPRTPPSPDANDGGRQGD